MIWIVGILLAFLFIKMGMLILMVKILSGALQLVMLALGVALVVYLWRRFVSHKMNNYMGTHHEKIDSRLE